MTIVKAGQSDSTLLGYVTSYYLSTEKQRHRLKNMLHFAFHWRLKGCVIIWFIRIRFNWCKDDQKTKVEWVFSCLFLSFFQVSYFSWIIFSDEKQKTFCNFSMPCLIITPYRNIYSTQWLERKNIFLLEFPCLA